jgi:ClpP class serine protease
MSFGLSIKRKPMLSNYFGAYMMHEPTLMAYERLARTALAKGEMPGFMQMAENARANRKMELIPTKGSNWTTGYDDFLSYAKKLNTPRAPIFEISGALSRHGECNRGYEDLMGVISASIEDEEVKVLGLKLDTAGGGVDGVVGVSEMIIQAKRAGKRVEVWGGFIASAGYHISSHANGITLDKQKVSEIGSIGTLMMYVNQKEALEKQGFKAQIIRATKSTAKAAFNSIEEPTEDMIAEEIKILDELNAEFHGYVRRGRRGKLTSEEWEDARMFNAKDALRVGLIDNVMGLYEWKAYLNKF